MAIAIPGDWVHVKKAELVGYVPAGVDPVDTMAQRSHWMYRYHTPALFSAMLWNGAATTQTAFFPVSPSADGLSYTISVSISYTGNDTYTLRTYYTTGSATAGATWVLIDTDAAALSGAPTHSTRTAAGVVPSTAKFLKVLTSTGASTNHQITGITVYPTGDHTPAATNSSGFIAFDNGFMGSGAPVHTEYLNRCINNAEAVYKDRKWCVFSFVQSTALTYRLAGAASGVYRTIGMAQATMPDDLLTRTATVKVRANDSAGTNGFVEVFQVNGQTTGSTLTADDTDRTTTLTLTGSKPVIGARAVANGTIDVHYISVEVSPTLEKQGASKDMITAAAPPARSEYLTTIDGLQSRLYWQPYPVTGIVMNPDLFTAGHLIHMMRIGPGIKRFRPCVTRHITGEGADVVLGMAGFNNVDSGTNAHERILVFTAATGNVEKHPISGTTDAEKTATGFVEWGSLVDIASPSAGTYPAGVDRLAEVVESDQPQLEAFAAFAYMYGLGGEFIRTDDVTTL